MINILSIITIYTSDLTLGQVVIKRVAVLELGVNNGSGDGGGCFGIKVWTDTAKLADIVIARFGDRWDLIGKSAVFIKYEAKVSSRVRGGERFWQVVYWDQWAEIQSWTLGDPKCRPTLTIHFSHDTNKTTLTAIEGYPYLRILSTDLWKSNWYCRMVVARGIRPRVCGANEDRS